MKVYAVRTILAAAVAAIAGSTANAAVLYDNMTSAEAGVTGATLSSTSSTPNTFMGDVFGLVSGATDITGFDIFPVNATTKNYNALKITIYVWGTVNTGTVSATTPAFSNLLGQYTLTSTGTFTAGFYYAFEGATIGTDPGVTLATPLAIPSNIIGITLSYQGSTNGGVTYATANNLTSLISYGVAPDVGTNPFLDVASAGTGGYYRNAGSPSETNGNFTSAYRAFAGTNENLGIRIYGDAVPGPSAAGLLAIGGLVASRRRRA